MTIDNLVMHWVQTHFNDTKAFKTECIQTLWSGYGEISRYAIPSIKRTVIIKIVRPAHKRDHPRGWDSSTSHKRKVDSYLNELTFYNNYANKTDALCRVPTPIWTSADKNVEVLFEMTAKKSDDENSHNEAISLLMMEDLDAAGFELRFDQASLSAVKLGLRWLAYFHAKYLGQALEDLWSVGTYWHFATRPDEFNKMPQSQLKENAIEIDQQLNGARYQTLLHGDAKLANFCFTPDSTNLAGLDFQYVGRGAGIKDLMYFLGSCLHSDELEQHADSFVDEYFSLLKSALIKNAIHINFSELEAEWRYLYAFAWADFNRFLQGWAPEHTKINDYMHKQTVIALASCCR